MGCYSSKLDDLPAVCLCRERCSSIDEAIRLRYSLSNSHTSYFHSLSSISPSFSSFFPIPSSSYPPPPPKPTLPSPSSVPDDDDDVSLHDDDFSDDSNHLHLHDSGDLSPLHHHSSPALASAAGGFYQINYMRNKASTPSVVYEQRPVTYHTVHFGEPSSSSSMPPYPYQKTVNPYPNNVGIGGGDGGVIYPNYGFPGYGNGGMGGGYYTNSPTPPQSYSVQAKPPLPPPSPPRASAWDFLNPFESYDKYYPTYTPSRDSMELREEEGIPDLEDENEVVKEVHGKPKFVGHGNHKFVDHGNQKFVDMGKSHGHARKGVIIEEDEEEEDDDEDGEDEFHRRADSEESMYQGRPSVVSIGNDEGNDDGAEYEVHVVDKKVVGGEGRSGQRGGGAARGSRSVAEALAEIELQFRRASECGTEVAELLEVGKLPYSRKHRGTILPVAY